MKVYLRSIICVLLAIGLLVAFVSCKNDKDGENDTSGGDYQIPGTGDKEGSYMVTEGLLVYYIYNAAFSFTETELVERGFDEEKSLKEQMYDENNTWYDILINRALEALVPLLTYCNAAAEDGVKLETSDMMAIEENLYQKRVTAAIEGYELDDYLAVYYKNSYITEEELQYTYELQYLMSKYSDILEERFSADLTEQMVADYLDKNGTDDTTMTRDIGNIIFTSDTYGSEEAAKAQAEASLAELKNKGLTAASFEEYAADKSASKVVFYNNVSRGDMMTEIDEWLWGDETRRVGDIGVITSSYGAHIIYYESEGDPVNVANAKVALIDEMFEKWYNTNKALYSTGITNDLVVGLNLDF